MGEKIDFPLNDKFYFDQAIEHLMNEDFERAIEKFGKVYANDKSFEVNRLYSATLFTSERFEEALEVANDQKDNYNNNEEMSIFYTMILIKNHLFLEAEVLIQNHLLHYLSPFHSEWQSADKELEKERSMAQLEKEQEILKCVKELHALESYPPIKHSEIIANAHIADLSDLQKVAERIFIDPQIPSTTQKALLELLIEKEDTQSYMFNWLDGPRKITPNELKLFDEVEVMKKIAPILESKLEKHPSFIKSIWTEMVNDLLILYPFADEIIINTDLWVELYLQTFDFIPTGEQKENQLTSSEKEMKEWHDYLNQIAQRT